MSLILPNISIAANVSHMSSMAAVIRIQHLGFIGHRTAAKQVNSFTLINNSLIWNTQLATCALHRSFKDIANAQFAADVDHVHVPTLVGKG